MQIVLLAQVSEALLYIAAATTLEDDIGKVVAKAVNDPRAANKKLVIKVNTLTQNEIIETWERVSGKKVARTTVSAEELDEQLQSALSLIN